MTDWGTPSDSGTGTATDIYHNAERQITQWENPTSAGDASSPPSTAAATTPESVEENASGGAMAMRSSQGDEGEADAKVTADSIYGDADALEAEGAVLIAQPASLEYEGGASDPAHVSRDAACR